MRETEVPEQDMETGLLERKPVPPTAAAQPKPVSPKPRPADAHTPKINPGPVAQPARGAVPRHIPATPISQEPISEKEHRTLASEQKPVNRSTIPAETKPSQNEQPTALGNQRSADETTGKTETLSPEMSQEFRFLMTENTLVIHTDEFI